MEFYDVIKTRRSIRKYSGRDIPLDVLKRVLDAARIAPSGNNRQPWSFIIVKDPEKKKKIAEASYGQSFIAEAPVVVVCCAQRYPNSYEPWKDDCYLADVIIAIDYLILAARNEGLGTCWIGAIHDKEAKKILNIPDEIDVVMVVPIGYPSSDSAFTDICSRKSLEEICFLEEYGMRTGSDIQFLSPNRGKDSFSRTVW